MEKFWKAKYMAQEINEKLVAETGIKKSYLIRLALMPFAVIGSFAVTAILALMVAKEFGLWEEAFVGFCSAFTVILVAYWLSPVRRILISSIWLAVGAISAKILLADPIYTEASTNQWTPLILTVLGGLSGLLISMEIMRGLMRNKRKQTI